MVARLRVHRERPDARVPPHPGCPCRSLGEWKRSYSGDRRRRSNVTLRPRRHHPANIPLDRRGDHGCREYDRAVATGCDQPARVSGRDVKTIPIANTARPLEGRTPTGVRSPPSTHVPKQATPSPPGRPARRTSSCLLTRKPAASNSPRWRCSSWSSTAAVVTRGGCPSSSSSARFRRWGDSPGLRPKPTRSLSHAGCALG
jgi:hypothetical protein